MSAKSMPAGMQAPLSLYIFLSCGALLALLVCFSAELNELYITHDSVNYSYSSLYGEDDGYNLAKEGLMAFTPTRKSREQLNVQLTTPKDHSIFPFHNMLRYSVQGHALQDSHRKFSNSARYAREMSITICVDDKPLPLPDGGILSDEVLATIHEYLDMGIDMQWYNVSEGAHAVDIFVALRYSPRSVVAAGVGTHTYHARSIGNYFYYIPTGGSRVSSATGSTSAAASRSSGADAVGVAVDPETPSTVTEPDHSTDSLDVSGPPPLLARSGRSEESPRSPGGLSINRPASSSPGAQEGDLYRNPHFRSMLLSSDTLPGPNPNPKLDPNAKPATATATATGRDSGVRTETLSPSSGRKVLPGIKISLAAGGTPSAEAAVEGEGVGAGGSGAPSFSGMLGSSQSFGQALAAAQAARASRDIDYHDIDKILQRRQLEHHLTLSELRSGAGGQAPTVVGGAEAGGGAPGAPTVVNGVGDAAGAAAVHAAREERRRQQSEVDGLLAGFEGRNDQLYTQKPMCVVAPLSDFVWEVTEANRAEQAVLPIALSFSKRVLAYEMATCHLQQRRRVGASADGHRCGLVLKMSMYFRHPSDPRLHGSNEYSLTSLLDAEIQDAYSEERLFGRDGESSMHTHARTLSNLFEHSATFVANKTAFEARVRSAEASTVPGAVAQVREDFSNSRNEFALNDIIVINLRSGREDSGEYGLPSGLYTLGFNLYINTTDGDRGHSLEKLVAWDVLRLHSKNSFQ